MKKFLFCALAFGMVACAKDATDGVPGVGTGETDVNFLSVKLSTTMGTRALTDGNWADGDYADGTGDETKVNKVRFYFFNGNNAAIVDYATNASYRDWVPPTEGFEDGTVEDGDKPNVEHVLAATLILEAEKGGVNTPTHLIAVLNPTTAVDALGKTPTQAQVLAYTADLTEGFVMTNSSYVADGAVQNVNNITGFLKPTAALAEQNPVTIYVERVVAKVTMSVSLEKETVDGVDLYDTGVANPNIEGENIYVKFTGWNATATTDKSFLVKSIDAGWDNSLSVNNLFKTANEPWNWEQYFRSFWAINPTGVNYLYGPFDSDTTAETIFPEGADVVNAANGIEVEKAAYIPENAGQTADAAVQARPTQVIIAAKLVNKDGTELELAEYAGTKMSVAQLKAAYLQSLQNTNKVFYREMTEEELQAANDKAKQEDDEAEEITEGYVSVTVDDIDFKTAWQTGEDVGGYEKQGGRYYVYAQLTEAAAAKTWYNSDAKGTKESEANKVDADAVLKSLGHSKVWKEGMTYYFFDIRHLAQYTFTADPYENPDEYASELSEAKTIPGFYGVVRNHVYKTNIKTLVGLGTPVFDPNEVIYPEKPNDELVYLAAEIKILSWRVVNSDVDLDWK